MHPRKYSWINQSGETMETLRAARIRWTSVHVVLNRNEPAPEIGLRHMNVYIRYESYFKNQTKLGATALSSLRLIECDNASNYNI